MTENKRYVFVQDGIYHTVRDTVENKPLIVMEFEENQFAKYALFHKIIDLLNDYYEENKQLKQQSKKNVFKIIDKNIKEIKKLYENGRIDSNSYNSVIITLTGLKEELQL